MCRSALSARSSSAHDLPGRFAPDAPLQTASVYVKIVLDTQNCILFCVFEIFIWDFCAKSIFDVCWILSSLPLRGVWIEIAETGSALCVNGVAPLAGSVDRNTTVYTDYANYNRSLPSRGAWIEMGSSCPGRSFWPICAPFRLSRGAALSDCPDGRAVPQPVGQGFPAASKTPAPKIWPNAAFCRPAACHFWEEAPDSGTGPAAERDAAAGCRHPKPAESLSSAPPSSRARRKSI